MTHREPTSPDRIRRSLLVLLLACAWFPLPSPAHEGRPVRVQIEEREPDAFFVQWIVPKTLPPEAIPQPVLPESCEAVGEPEFIDRRGVWLNRREYRCPEGLSGAVLAMGWPVHNPSMTTLFRLDLLSGRRLVHVLLPGERVWTLPEFDEAGVALLRQAAQAVGRGAAHLFGDWLHVAFLAAICFAAGIRRAIPSITLFAAGQLAAVALESIAGIGLPVPLAELGLAVAVLVLALAALPPVSEQRNFGLLAAATGVVHGFALTGVSEGAAAGLFHVLGMDAALLTLAGVGWLVVRVAGRMEITDGRRRILAYVLGGAAAAWGIGLAVSIPDEMAGAVPGPRSAAPVVSAEALPGSRRVAPRNPDLPIRGFLDIEAYEVRHEVLLRLDEVAGEAALDLQDPLPPARQSEVARALGRFVVEHTTVRIDGERAEPIVDRVEFVTLGKEGALPRVAPVEESLGEAVVGVTLAYLTPAIPREVELSWTPFPSSVRTIQSTAIDPESSRAEILMPERPTLSWINELAEDPVAGVAAVAVEPLTLSLPLVSLPLLIAAGFFVVRGATGRTASISFAAARLLLALAVFAGPWATLPIAVPGTSGTTPSEPRVRRILAGLLPNVYRSFELRDESAAFDRLAASVSGATLTEVYLQHRQALVMEERGGARARVEAVELLEVSGVEPTEAGGFEAEAEWTVAGTVTHFGHRHFRQNRYRARVVVAPDSGNWKIRSIEATDEQRLR